MYVEMVTMTVPAENEEAFLSGRAAVIETIRQRFPDLRRATLVRLEDGRWVDWVEWASLEQAQAAAEEAPGMEAVAEWFGLIGSVQSMQHGRVAHQDDPDHRATGAGRG